jgi:hypothetical protein
MLWVAVALVALCALPHGVYGEVDASSDAQVHLLDPVVQAAPKRSSNLVSREIASCTTPLAWRC